MAFGRMLKGFKGVLSNPKVKEAISAKKSGESSSPATVSGKGKFTSIASKLKGMGVASPNKAPVASSAKGFGGMLSRLAREKLGKAVKEEEKEGAKPFRKGGAVSKKPAAKKPGLYANINAKKKRIAAGSGEKMRKPGAKGAPSAMDFMESAKTAKKPVKRAGGSGPKGESVYEVLGRRVTKEQYDEAAKEMDRPKSKVEEDMDDFAKRAKERARIGAPKKMKTGGMACGGAPKKMKTGGSVSCGPATKGYGAARKPKK